MTKFAKSHALVSEDIEDRHLAPPSFAILKAAVESARASQLSNRYIVSALEIKALSHNALDRM